MSNNPEQPKTNQENNIDITGKSFEQLEKISRRETTNELSPRDAEAQAERVKQEALGLAISVESSGNEKDKINNKSLFSKKGPISKKIRDESYSRTMKQVQSELSIGEKIFSKVIHNKVIEKTSDITGSTIARPNAMLAGAIFAFLISLVTYLTAKTIGYQLSGFETILAFTFGWLIGIIYDYFRLLFAGKK